MTELVGEIIMQTEMDGEMPIGVVLQAPPVALVSAKLLVDVALGRATDASLTDLGLAIGVPGRGLGRVRYRVEEYIHADLAYRVVREPDLERLEALVVDRRPTR